MDKTILSYFNEYVSLMGKGKFNLMGGNQFLGATGPKIDEIVSAINKYTTTDGVTADGVFKSRLKNKAESGAADDAKYNEFVAEWNGLKKQLVDALFIHYDNTSATAAAAPAAAAATGKSPGLYGGVITPEELSKTDALRAAADMAAVKGVVAVVHVLLQELIKIKLADMNLTTDKFVGKLAEIKTGLIDSINSQDTKEKKDSRRDRIAAKLNGITLTDGSKEDILRDRIVASLNGLDFN